MGLDLGLEKAGIEVILACESDRACRETIKLNKPEIALLDDIRDYTPQQIREAAGLTAKDDIDLVVGGPPCQAFSTAGKRKAFHDDRGNVFLDYIQKAIALRPKFIVIENVRGLLSCPLQHRPHNQRGKNFPPLLQEESKGSALFHVIGRLRQNGYSVSFNLYNSANFGTPQIRERVAIVCARNGKKVPYLEPTHSQSSQFNLPQWQTFYEAVQGLEKVLAGRQRGLKGR